MLNPDTLDEHWRKIYDKKLSNLSTCTVYDLASSLRKLYSLTLKIGKHLQSFEFETSHKVVSELDARVSPYLNLDYITVIDLISCRHYFSSAYYELETYLYSRNNRKPSICEQFFPKGSQEEDYLLRFRSYIFTAGSYGIGSPKYAEKIDRAEKLATFYLNSIGHSPLENYGFEYGDEHNPHRLYFGLALCSELIHESLVLLRGFVEQQNQDTYTFTKSIRVNKYYSKEAWMVLSLFCDYLKNNLEEGTDEQLAFEIHQQGDNLLIRVEDQLGRVEHFGPAYVQFQDSITSTTPYCENDNLTEQVLSSFRNKVVVDELAKQIANEIKTSQAVTEEVKDQAAKTTNEIIYNVLAKVLPDYGTLPDLVSELEKLNIKLDNLNDLRYYLEEVITSLPDDANYKEHTADLIKGILSSTAVSLAFMA